jgi:WD40 repeat protein
MRLFLLVVMTGLLAAAAGPADGPPSAEELDRLILKLGDDDLATRSAVRKQLEAIGEPAADALRKASASSDDPEVRTAANALLEVFAAKASGLIHMFRGSQPGVAAIAISADGRFGVSAHDDWAIRFWDLDHQLLTRQIAKHVTPVLSVAISPDGKRVLSGSGARMIRLWDSQTGAEVRNFVAPAESIYALAFAPDGKSFLSGWGDGKARLFDIETGKVRQTLAAGGGRVFAIAFTPDCKYAVTGSRNEGQRLPTAGGDLKVWDVATGKLIRQFGDHPSDFRRVAVSPDGMRLLSDSGLAIQLWDLSTGKELKRFDEIDNSTPAMLTPDGKRVIGSQGDSQQTLRMLDVNTGRELKALTGHRGQITCFAISADGRRLFSGSSNGDMGLWELPK